MGASMGAFVGHFFGYLFPGLNTHPVVFAIAGMSAGVGASTGAIITGAVMILEMTRDSNVVLPIMITSAFAYGIRKWLSPGSIYTLKLLRRGHVVPEGLQAALSESMTVQDIMVRGFETAEPESEIKASRFPILVKEHENIIGIVPPHVSGKMAQSLALKTYLYTPEKNPIHDLYREMRTTGSRFALVTGSAEGKKVQEIIGIVSEKEVALHAMHEAELK